MTPRAPETRFIGPDHPPIDSPAERAAFFDALRSAKSFQSFVRVTDRLDHANEHNQDLGGGLVRDMQQQLLVAEYDADHDPTVPKSLALRIATARVFTPMTATLPRAQKLVERGGQPAEFIGTHFETAYPALAEIGAKTLDYHQAYVTRATDLTAQTNFGGFIPEITLLMLQMRSGTIALPASARADFLNNEACYDAVNYSNNGGVLERTNLQLKSNESKDQSPDTQHNPILTIYGSRDLVNDIGNHWWKETQYYQTQSPTLSALLDEIGGDNSVSHLLDSITDNLNAKIARHNQLRSDSQKAA